MIQLTLDLRHNILGLGRFLPASRGEFKGEDGKKISKSHVSTLLAGKRVLLLISGYNTSAEAADHSYNTIQAGLSAQAIEYDAAIEVLWPTSSKPGYWFALFKVYQETFGNGVGESLRAILRQCLGSSVVDVIAHSLGNAVIGTAIKRGDVPSVRHVFWTNAAVPSDALSVGGFFHHGVRTMTGEALVFHSDKDEVLKIAYSGAEGWLSWFRGKPAQALGFAGPSGQLPPNARAVNASEWCMSHSDARNHVEYYEAIAWTVKGRN